MNDIHVKFLDFLNISPKRLQYLIEFGDVIDQLKIESVRKKVIDSRDEKQLINEYSLDIKRNNLITGILLNEIIDVNKPYLKKVEYCLFGDRGYFTLESGQLKYNSFGFSEKLFLDFETGFSFLQALLIDFNLYHNLRELIKNS